MRIEADAVLFDNDGVLVDSHAPTRAGWRRICDAYGMDFVEVSAQLAGVRAIDTLARFLPADQVDEAFARLEQFEIDESDGVVAFPGALDLVAALPAGRWTIVSSATPPLAELARPAGVHPAHLARSFRRWYGCTPGHYLRRRRLEEAARLLATTDRPVVEIALGLGFYDQAHLTRRFRRPHGLSPARFRRACRRRGA